MTIVKFVVDNWSDKPKTVEYAKQSTHFYIKANGGRDSIISRYYSYFDAEAEALEFIVDRNAKRARSKEVDQIKRHAVELLEALEACLADLESESMPSDESFSLMEKARTAIAKAKGTAQ